MLREINFDGIVGPSHNFAGLSLGNLAAARNAGSVSHPRAAALEGLAKMRANLDLGLVQGILLPHDRPNGQWLAQLGTTVEQADPALRANALSAAPMWAANAATVSPGPDTADGRCHLTVANLVTMSHRSHEWPGTLAQLRLAFADTRHFIVHSPVPATFGDEGAANHLRLCAGHAAPGIEVFAYGTDGSGESIGPFPARQHVEASRAVCRQHGLEPDRVILVQQSRESIASGAFHTDVVAVTNERVLFTHERAFEDTASFYDALQSKLPDVHIIEVPASVISLAEAITTYVFNSQLVTLPEGSMALVCPIEVSANPRIRSWLNDLVARGGPIRKLVPVDVRQSMANGGGPACLRLRVVVDPATVDQRFVVDQTKLDLVESVIKHHWPECISCDELGKPGLWKAVRTARATLLKVLDLSCLEIALIEKHLH